VSPAGDLFGPQSEGQTPLPEELRVDLIPTWVSTLGDLYDAEQEGIAVATVGLHAGVDQLLDTVFLRRLHRAMFRNVWRWAGKTRTHDTNIGVPWPSVTTAMQDLVADARAWIDGATFDADEVAVRFHHRFEVVHPFANGNGRFGRIVADQLVVAMGRPAFTWGAGLDVDTADLRAAYLDALRRADRDPDDVAALLAFARS
jgi:Fic-DOC domain mobile mystery protein B